MTMKTIKVAEATNLQLNWLVAKCEDKRVTYCGAGPSAYFAYIPKRSAYKVWCPSTNPAQMWPIIEREEIDLISVGIENYRGRTEGGNPVSGYGTTRLIAAARCYVASKLGETVEVPEELT